MGRIIVIDNRILNSIKIRLSIIFEIRILNKISVNLTQWCLNFLACGPLMLFTKTFVGHKNKIVGQFFNWLFCSQKTENWLFEFVLATFSLIFFIILYLAIFISKGQSNMNFSSTFISVTWNDMRYFPFTSYILF